MLDSIGQWADAVPPLHTPLAEHLAGYRRSLTRRVTKLDCNWLRLKVQVALQLVAIAIGTTSVTSHDSTADLNSPSHSNLRKN